ncbi:MAG: hypothetical protein M3042_04190, partial [Actinomycetota bacterium]|nr:hypothetical protein [Actinomycetota bacterium]
MVQIDRVLDVPPTPTTVSPAPRRRRWPALILLVLVLIVSVLVAGGAYLAHYQPLGPGNGEFDVKTTGSTQIRTLENAWGTDYRIVSPKAGDHFDIYFAIANSGALPVTITRIAQPFNSRGTVGDPSHPDSTSAGQVSFATGPSLQDFRSGPVTLAPGGNAQVRLSFTVLDCATVADPRLVSSGTTVTVTYRTFGFSHTREIAVGDAVSAVGMPTCP